MNSDATLLRRDRGVVEVRGRQVPQPVAVAEGAVRVDERRAGEAGDHSVGSVPSTTSILSRVAGTRGGVGELQVVGDVVLAVGARNGSGECPIGVNVIAVNASGTVTPATEPAGGAAVAVVG